MALWQIDVEKVLGTEYWTNVYHVDATSQADAATQGLAIALYEQDLHNVDINLTKYRVSPFPGPSEGTIYPLNLPGQGPDGDRLPLFNVLRVDFAVTTGRPSRKYYRIGITEGEQVDGRLTDAAREGYEAVVLAFVNDPDIHYVDVDGQPIVQGTVYPLVGMRQLRRGTRRRTTPVI